MPEARIATVAYLNTLPLIEGLDETAGITLERVVPSRVVDRLTEGGDDIGLVSAIDLCRAGLVPLPVGMIGCEGPTMTVRLFSRVPLAEVEVLHADTDSHTSVALAQVLLDRLHGARPEVRDFDPRERAAEGAATAGDPEESWPESVLLIGDKVVVGSPPAVRYPHQLDLGEAWHGLTALPFVYAIWACVAGREDDEAVRSAAVLLDRQRRRNAMRIDWIVSQRAPRMGWPGDLARQYVGDLLRYEVGPREREGLEAFLGMAHDLGLCPEPTLAWPAESAT
ncbi:MAG: menaquinone biosynthesis protein [Planctomycetota bacterium]